MSKTLTVKLPGKSPVTLTNGALAAFGAAVLEAQEIAVQTLTADASPVYSGDAPWSGEIGFEGRLTGDGRYINKGALFFDASQLPMPLRYAPEDVGAHGGAQVIGLIQTLSLEKGVVKATGIIDGSTELGARVIAGLQKGTIKGVSMDLDDFEMEVRLRKEVYDEIVAANEAFMEMLMGDGEEDEEQEKPKEDVAEVEGEDYVKVGEYKADDEVMYITKARVRAATLVDIPAFAEAYVALDAPAEEKAEGDRYSLVASAPTSPPAAWFEDPKLAEPTPLTFHSDGRVEGHIALWGTCHTQFPGACVTPPFSRTNYAWFRTGVLLTDDGEEVPVGAITFNTGHAPGGMSARPAAAHYDNTGAVGADVACGEDAHGIWVAGAMRSGLTDEQLRELRAAPMSGDWRMVGGNLELVGILGVNTPGFMVPRVKALVASGRTTALIRPVESVKFSDEPGAVQDDMAKLALELLLNEHLSNWDKEVGL